MTNDTFDLAAIKARITGGDDARDYVSDLLTECERLQREVDHLTHHHKAIAERDKLRGLVKRYCEACSCKCGGFECGEIVAQPCDLCAEARAALAEAE